LFNDAIIVLRKVIIYSLIKTTKKANELKHSSQATGMSGKKWKCEIYFQLDNAYFAAEASDEGITYERALDTVSHHHSFSS